MVPFQLLSSFAISESLVRYQLPSTTICRLPFISLVSFLSLTFIQPFCSSLCIAPFLVLPASGAPVLSLSVSSLCVAPSLGFPLCCVLFLCFSLCLSSLCLCVSLSCSLPLPFLCSFSLPLPPGFGVCVPSSLFHLLSLLLCASLCVSLCLSLCHSLSLVVSRGLWLSIPASVCVSLAPPPCPPFFSCF